MHRVYLAAVAALLVAPAALAHEGEHWHLHPHGIGWFLVGAGVVLAGVWMYRQRAAHGGHDDDAPRD